MARMRDIRELQRVFGTRVLLRRRELGIRQDELARRAGYASHAMLSGVERCRRLPGWEHALRLADALGVELWELLVPTGPALARPRRREEPLADSLRRAASLLEEGQCA